MTKYKLKAPISTMDEKQYKLSYFSEQLSEFELKQSKFVKKGKICYKKLKQWFKKDILHIEMFKPICPDCYTKKVHKNGVNNRILYFYDKKKVNAEIQRYKCEKYGKNFYTNINDIVSEN